MEGIYIGHILEIFNISFPDLFFYYSSSGRKSDQVNICWNLCPNLPNVWQPNNLFIEVLKGSFKNCAHRPKYFLNDIWHKVQNNNLSYTLWGICISRSTKHFVGVLSNSVLPVVRKVNRLSFWSFHFFNSFFKSQCTIFITQLARIGQSECGIGWLGDVVMPGDGRSA